MTGFDRRTLLRRAGAMGLVLAGCGGSPSSSRSRGRVVVVGAGLAGLAAARELDRAGFDVTVVEARTRIGGRVHTVRFPDGQHAEAGGEFIDSTHEVLRGYAKDLGLELEDLNEQGTDLPAAVYADRERSELDSVLTPNVRAEIDRYEARIEELAEPLDPSDPLRHGAALDRRSMADLLDDLELEETARLLVEHNLRGEYTVEPDRLSVLFHAHLTRVGADTPESGVEAFRIRGGNTRLAEAIAEELEGEGLAGTPVEAISRTERGLTIHSGRRVFRADWCVLAVPAPILRTIHITPSLPAEVHRWSYGTAVKNLLQYDRRVWRDQGFDGETTTDLPIGATWEATDGQPGRAGILLVYTGGAAATRVSTEDALRQVDEIYPGSISHAQNSQEAAWHTERYTGGSYFAPAPGEMTASWAARRRPYGRLVLAGEHTDVYASYMEGALRSGRRAAGVIATVAP